MGNSVYTNRHRCIRFNSSCVVRITFYPAALFSRALWSAYFTLNNNMHPSLSFYCRFLRVLWRVHQINTVENFSRNVGHVLNNFYNSCVITTSGLPNARAIYDLPAHTTHVSACGFTNETTFLVFSRPTAPRRHLGRLFLEKWSATHLRHCITRVVLNSISIANINRIWLFLN